MNREFKFRLYNTSTKKMINPKHTTPLALSPDLVCDGVFLPFRDEWPLMQYTGLKDKNDKEIYEGDIINLSAKSHTERLGSIDKEWIVVVTWDDIKSCFVLFNKERNLTWMFNDTDYNGKTFMKEIIGNIHEHPQLLS